MGFPCPDLGTHCSHVNQATMLAAWDSVPCANTWVYFAVDPENGGQPIGRRFKALEEGFCLRCRS
jgi:hypothetical protein